MKRNKDLKKELELYIHIPFCIRKCAYCDFLSGPADDKTIECYVGKLIEEIQAHGAGETMDKNIVTTIFFGGGTPSILSGSQMRRIMEAVKANFDIAEDAEISMEANPGTVTKEKLECYRQAGINRISFGLQSADDEELKLLGRIHTWEEFLESFQLARECGFDNINVDLISAIPKQTLESWESSLRNVIALEPEHISAYSLIVEEGTPFYEKYGEGAEGEVLLPSEEDERQMYHCTEALLREAGYHRYEISNYAKPGRECRHNLGYWERKKYLGIGLGASGLIDNVRYKNTECLEDYIQWSCELNKIQKEREILSKAEQMEEFIFLGLRKMAGVSLKEFEDTFEQTLEECYGKNIRRMIEKELLVMEEEVLKLTKAGIDISNYVFAELLS